MDFGEMIDDVKSGISDTIQEKPQVVAVAVGILVLFVAGLTILAVQTSPHKAKQKQQVQFNANAPVFVPDPPNVENSYYQYRTTPLQWNTTELKNSFTEPDESAMELLEKANDGIVDEITEAAP